MLSAIPDLSLLISGLSSVKGKGPFRWAALSGDPEDIYKTDEAILKEFPDDESLARWIRLAREKVKFQGLPARICWLGYGQRARIGKVFNDMVAKRELKAPIVIGRDHLDSGSVASPYRETEGMKDGSDAIADWPILECSSQYGGRSHVGFGPSRGRSWDRLLHSCGHGGGGGWDEGCREKAHEGVDNRSRNRRDAPCRCRI